MSPALSWPLDTPGSLFLQNKGTNFISPSSFIKSTIRLMVWSESQSSGGSGLS